ncbi:MMPL family transporter [Methyloligella sp. 2.7D]|uniref:efflux RND transporter permease subunit n=1 Tax=unclassified Methyloligella TaxID=2625955 RepID=UPI00157D2171|nr:MMPL family transporter [Methyloligella sp. GL2]QKP76367.1 MMPL family transporter [Methyloligella sp. GL2]
MQNKQATKRVRSLSFGLERIGLLSLHYPILMVVLLTAITVAAFFGIQRLKVDDSLSELFHSDTPEFHTYETLSSRFPSSEYDVLIVITGKTLLERSSLEALRDLVLELQFVDGMSGEVSLFSAREAPEPGKIPGPVVPAELPTGKAYDDLIQQVRDNQIIKGKLLSDDGTLTLILLALDRETVASKGLEHVVTQIHDTAAQILGPTGLEMKLSGAPVMQLEIRNAVKHDRDLYNALGFLFGAIIAYAFFRRFSLMVIAAMPPIIAIVWSLGLFGWLGFKLNLFLNVMIPLIMVLGFSDSMQLTVATRDRMLSGKSRLDASRYALLVVGPACVLSSTTAAASFIALFFSSSALIRTFGFAGALSTLLAFLICITVVPLLTRLLIAHDHKFATDMARDNKAMEVLKGGCAKLAGFVIKRPVVIMALGIFAVVTLGAIYTNLPPRYRLADQVPDQEQAVAASAELDKKLTGANPLHVMIDWPDDMSLYDPEVLRVIGEVHQAVQSEPDVGNVWSIETLRRWLAETGEDTPQKLKEYVDILPGYLTQRFINPEAHSAVVTGRVPDIDVSNLLPVIEKLEKRLDVVRKYNPQFTMQVTGLSAIAARNSASMISNLNMGLTTEIAFICLFLGLVFRSWLVVVVSVVPILFPVFSAGAMLALSGEGLQFASIVALIVAFGLSLNATVHYLNRLRLETREGEDPSIGVERATVLIGPALVLTSVILAFGLGVTVLSALPSLRLFGKLAALTLIAALVGDLVLLPACVLVIRRMMAKLRGGGSAETEKANA